MIKRNCSSISQLDVNEPAILVVELNIECINTTVDTIAELNSYIIISYTLSNNLISNFTDGGHLHFTYIFSSETYTHGWLFCSIKKGNSV